MSVWYFQPNTELEYWSPETGYQTDDVPGRWDWRWVQYFIKWPQGISVWQDASNVWHEGRFPSQDDVNFAKWMYWGGAVSIVDDTNKAAILAAGLTITTDNFTLAPDGTPITPPPHGDTGQPMPPTYDISYDPQS